MRNNYIADDLRSPGYHHWTGFVYTVCDCKSLIKKVFQLPSVTERSQSASQGLDYNLLTNFLHDYLSYGRWQCAC